MWQKLSHTYPLRLEIIPLLLLLLTFYLTLSSYPSLPDRIPTHFGIQGTPDRWGGKNEIFVYPAVSAFVYVMFTAINVLLALAKDQRKFINLPQKQKVMAALTELQIEKLRLFINRSLFAMKVIILGLMLYSLYSAIEIACGRASGLAGLWFLFMLAILALSGYMVWKSMRITAE